MAVYCSLKLPEFLKTNENYKKGNYKEALEEAFIAFDATLTDRAVVAELKKIAGNNEAEESEEENEDEVSELFEEANMSIEDIVAKYTTSPSGKSAKPVSEEPSGEGSAKPVNPAIASMRKEKKPCSPFLRAKTSAMADSAIAGTNKHIRFNADGSVQENGVGVEVKEEEKEGKEDVKDTDASAQKQETKTEVDEKSEETPKTPVNGGSNGSAEVEDSPEGSEKENKDTNSLANGDIMDEEGNIIRGKNKGKGKGKGKSKGKSEDLVAEVDSKDKRPKKSASEIYETLLKPEVEEGDEDSEDSDDMEYGEAEGIEEEDSDDCEDDVEEESEDESEEEDEECEDEEEEGEPVEADFTEEPGNDSGCTSVVALLSGTTLYVANAGDSR